MHAINSKVFETGEKETLVSHKKERKKSIFHLQELGDEPDFLGKRKNQSSSVLRTEAEKPSGSGSVSSYKVKVCHLWDRQKTST